MVDSRTAPSRKPDRPPRCSPALDDGLLDPVDAGLLGANRGVGFDQRAGPRGSRRAAALVTSTRQASDRAAELDAGAPAKRSCRRREDRPSQRSWSDVRVGIVPAPRAGRPAGRPEPASRRLSRVDSYVLAVARDRDHPPVLFGHSSQNCLAALLVAEMHPEPA